MHGDHEHEHSGVLTFERLDAGDARHARQADVEKRHGGRMDRTGRERLLHGPVPPDASKADGPIDEARQSLPNLALVFDNHHVDGARVLLVGRRLMSWRVRVAGRHVANVRRLRCHAHYTLR